VLGAPEAFALEPRALFAIAGVPLALAAVGGYQFARWDLRRPRHLLARLVVASSCVLWFTMLVGGQAASPLSTERLLMATVALPVSWFVVRQVAGRWNPARERTVVVGSGPVARHIAELAWRHSEQGVDVIGFVDDEPLALPPGFPPVLGRISDLAEISDSCAVDRIIVAFTARTDRELLQQLRSCDRLRVRVDVVPRMFDLLPSEGAGLGGLTLLPASRRFPTTSESVLKRMLDVLIAPLMLLLCAPLVLLIAVAIKIDDHGPIFYRQVRIGRNGKHFLMWKFRTMVVGADKNDAADAASGEGVADIARAQKHARSHHITRVGRILRRTSLDELPQLWNVLVGDMSLVGPRPLPPYQANALEPWQAARLDVLPGMTGLWQVLGRSEIGWHERMQLDYSYTRHQSLASDLSILARTVSAVINRRGAV
jgi:exopolysaccharide biosynthesis polyprenyl glycosylphosphotransferase